jgi:8-oxo-dGTP pyrophosphatase MutT (NUDIX family)
MTTSEGKNPSAVVIIFFAPLADDFAARIVFIRRSTTVRSHRGQIGFPGGRAEPSDRTPAETALRELHEELGLSPEKVAPIGFLPPVRALDGSAVVTVVATADAHLDELTIAPAEVESVFAAPWTRFTRAEDQAFRFNIFGNWRDSHLFPLPSRPIWGLTALLLARCDFGS